MLHVVSVEILEISVEISRIIKYIKSIENQIRLQLMYESACCASVN